MHERQVVRGALVVLMFAATTGLAACADEEYVAVRAPGQPPPPLPGAVVAAQPPVVEAAPGEAASGAMVIRSGASPSLCFDAAGDRVANHTPVRLFPCNGRESQRWSFARGETGTTVITGVGGMCLDIHKVHSPRGGNVQLFKCHGSDNQSYSYEPDGRLKELATGRCLAATSLEPRASIVAEPCDPAAPGQVWKVADR